MQHSIASKRSFLRLHGVSAARLRHIGHDFQRLPSRAEAHGLVLTLRSGQLSGSNKGRGNWKLLRQAGATARSLLEAAALTKSRPWALAWRCRFARDEKERHTGRHNPRKS
jgi:hypothetical protein